MINLFIGVNIFFYELGQIYDVYKSIICFLL
jgi:hypothetical protein